MKRADQVAVDTNIALGMINTLSDYNNSSNKEEYFLNRLEEANDDIKNSTTTFFNYIQTKLNEYKKIVANNSTIVVEVDKNKHIIPEDAQKLYDKLVEHYNSTTDEDQKRLVIKKMESVFTKTRSYTNNFNQKDSFTEAEKNQKFEEKRNLANQIKSLDKEINEYKVLIDNLPKDSTDREFYNAKIKEIKNNQYQLSLELEKKFTIEETWAFEEKRYNKMSTSLSKKIQDINGIKLCEKMIKGEVEIILPEFVYEELCNHTKEFNPYHKIAKQNITKGLVSKDALDNFTKNCTLSLVKDKELLEYLENLAYLARGAYKKEMGDKKNIEMPVKEKIIKKLKGEIGDSSKDANFFKQDVGSCGKFSDSLIAVYSNLAGVYLITNNIDDFIGAELDDWNGGKLKTKQQRRKLFEILTVSGAEVEGFKSLDVSDKESITFYEFEKGKRSKVKQSKLAKHVKVSAKKLLTYEKELNETFKHSGWSANFKQITELQNKCEFILLLADVKKERIEVEKEIVKDKIDNAEKKANKPKEIKTNKDKLMKKEEDEMLDIVNRVKEEKEHLDSMQNLMTPQSENSSTTNNVVENTKTNQAVQTQNNNNSKEKEDKGRIK